MREIKFRLWNETLGKYEGILTFETNFTFATRENEKVALEQYTGLKDKNGVDAYFGDIIKVDTYLMTGDYPTKEHVAFLDDSDFEFGARNLPRTDTSFEWTDLYDLNDISFEVIGNIHEEEVE